MRKLILYSIAFFTIMTGHAQKNGDSLRAQLYAHNNNVRPLEIGDTIPDILIHNIINFSSPSVSLSSYRNKLLLFDTWSVNCLGCIKSMPEMLALQEQFGQAIQIFFVTNDSKEAIDKLWNRLERNKSSQPYAEAGKKMPFIIEDTLLSLLFPHIGNPTNIWIDKKGVYRAMTTANTTTASNIKLFLQDKKTTLYNVPSQKNVHDLNDPLLWINENPGFDGQLSYYSFLFNRLNVIGGTTMPKVIRDSSTKKIVGISYLNKPIGILYKLAYFGYEKFPYTANNRIIADSALESKMFEHYKKYMDTSDIKWLNENLFCYALKVPVRMSNELYTVMREDLDRYFHLTSSLEKRNIKCLVLTTQEKNKPGTKGGIPNKEYLKDELDRPLTLTLTNMPFSTLQQWFKSDVRISDLSLPFINEVNYTGNIDVTLDISEKKTEQEFLRSLREGLAKCGLALTEEYRELEVVVVKENSH